MPQPPSPVNSCAAMLRPIGRSLRHATSSFHHLRRRTCSATFNTIPHPSHSHPNLRTSSSLLPFTSTYTSNQSRYITTAVSAVAVEPLNSRSNTVADTIDAYSAIELALDSVVKIFTVSSSPNYFLPWQNKSQRESMGSGFLIH